MRGSVKATITRGLRTTKLTNVTPNLQFYVRITSPDNFVNAISKVLETNPKAEHSDADVPRLADSVVYEDDRKEKC